MISKPGTKDGKRYWIELRVRTSEDLSEALVDFLVSELHRGVIVEEEQDKDSHTQGNLVIKAYLNEEDIESGALKGIETYFYEILELHSEYPRISWSTHQIVEEDWADGWKKYFKPLRLGKRLVVKPSWEPWVPDEEEVVIEIDPGRAFGVGTHASTRLMLETIEELAISGFLKDAAVLDIGTGTGILAIAAAKLGSSDVMAVDIDQDAVDTARKNIHLNHVHQRVFVSSTPIWELEGPFNLVLSNLDRDTLLFLSREIARLVAEGGVLLASGIIQGQDAEIIESYREKGLALVSTKNDVKEPEWLLLKFEKTG